MHSKSISEILHDAPEGSVLCVVASSPSKPSWRRMYALDHATDSPCPTEAKRQGIEHLRRMIGNDLIGECVTKLNIMVKGRGFYMASRDYQPNALFLNE